MKYIKNWGKFNESFFPSSDNIPLGSCPKGEKSVQVYVNNEYPKDDTIDDDADDNGDMYLAQDEPEVDPDYLSKQQAECNRYADMLQKRFVVCSNVNIYANREKYEGSDGYYDVIVKYDADDTDQKMQAHFIEDNLPDTWDDNRVFTPDEYQVWYDENLEYHTGSEF